MTIKKVIFPGVSAAYTQEELSSVPGMPHYGLRGLLCDVHAAYIQVLDDATKTIVQNLHHLLKEFNIGPQTVHISSEEPLHTYSPHIDEMTDVSVFAVTEHSRKYIPLEWLGTKVPDIKVSHTANSKVALREMYRENDRSFFPYHRIVDTKDAVFDIVNDVLRQSSTGKILVKEDHLASGEGIEKFSSVRDAVAHITSLLSKKPHNPIIVEEKVRKVHDGSIQFYVHRDSAEGIQFLGTTKQHIMDTTHEGNTITSDGSIKQFPFSTNDLIPKAKKLLRQFQSKGWWGFAVVDFVIDDNNVAYAIECNARMTASYFLWELKKQLLSRNSSARFAITSCVCETPWIQSWEDLTMCIGGSLFNGVEGIIPFMPIPGIKTGIIAVQKDIRNSEDLCFGTKKILENFQGSISRKKYAYV